MIGYDLISNNGESIGEVKDFYFDSKQLIIRYVVVDTGGWLTGRRVIIHMDSFEEVDWEKEAFSVDLSKEEIENSPSVDEQKPVSRQQEVDLAHYYDWPAYWAPIAGGHQTAYPARPVPLELDKSATDELDLTEKDSLNEENEACNDANCYLRSFKEVKGYNIDALDGEIGHLENLMVADENWVIQYLLVDTRNWLPGRKVLVAPEWLNRVSYNNKEIEVELHKETIKNSPEYNSEMPITRDYEKDLYEHYKKDRYW